MKRSRGTTRAGDLVVLHVRLDQHVVAREEERHPGHVVQDDLLGLLVQLVARRLVRLGERVAQQIVDLGFL